METLKAHLSDLIASNDRRYQHQFVAQEKAVATALKSAEQAVLKAESATERRFESVNEFRATLSDQTAGLIPRKEAEARMIGLAARVELLDGRVNRAEGAARGLQLGWAMLTGLVVVIGSIVGIIAATR